MDDFKLTELYFKRDQSAILETDAKYGKYCKSIAYNILEDFGDCEECVNDVYLKIWSTIPPERPINFKSFIGRITRNISLNRLKAKNADKRALNHVSIALEELGGCVPSVKDEYSSDGEITAALNEFLGDIKERERGIFVRRYWYLDSITTIAGRYGISESNVSTTLHRTRLRLKKYFEQRGIQI